MKRDISCNANKIEELKQDFKNRDPAKETYERLNKYNIEITRMGDKLDNIAQKLDTHTTQQQKDFDSMSKKLDEFIEAADGKYADGEQFRFWRNILITGIIISILVGIIGIVVDKLLH